MANSLTLRPDLGCEIEVTEQGEKIHYTSRLLGGNDRVLYLALPFENGLPVAISRGQPLGVYFKDKEALWHYETRVLNVRTTPHPLLMVPRPSKLRRLRRREYIRVKVRVEPKYFMLFDRKRDRGYPLDATILDVSGGGLLFISRTQVPEGEVVKTVFELPGGFGEVRATGKVANSRLAPRYGHGVYAMGVAFTRISDKHREAIIQFTLHRQTEEARRKRG